MFKEPNKVDTKLVASCAQCGKPVEMTDDVQSSTSLNAETICQCSRNSQKQTEAASEEKQAIKEFKNALTNTALFKTSTTTSFPDLGPRYEFLELLGQGGMGTVYRVKDKALNKDFAVKVLNPNLVQDQVSVKRFEQEAQAASSLTSPNLASVYSYGMSNDGSPFLVMDYLHGETLEKILKSEGFLDGERALNIFAQIASAIADAHQKEVIHRDIKPSNIIIEQRDNGVEFVKVVDFGIAKILPSQQQAAESLTQTGDIFGSPLYMSPEQCQGNMQDRRSDIYSLGCVMYEALTGKQPFAAENSVKIILKHVHNDITAISALKGDYKISPDLANIVMRCLEPEPQDRYESAEALLQDLQKVQSGERIKRKSPRHAKQNDARKKTLRLVVAMLVGAALAIRVITYISQPNVRLHPYGDAQSFDQKSYAYFQNGQYEKAAPLLEFGIPTYQEQIAQDLAHKDYTSALRDKTLLAENWQHIGKCYLMASLKQSKFNNLAAARKYLDKASEAYADAMPFYYEHGVWPGGSTIEAVSDYAQVLTKLNKEKELTQLKEFAQKWKIKLPSQPDDGSG